MKRRIFKSLMLTTLIIVGWSLSYAQPVLTLNSADNAPYSKTDDTGFYDQIIKKIFADQNIKIKINHLPSARSINNVNDGIDAGEYARTKGIQNNYNNLAIVDEKLVDFSFTVFSKSPDFQLESGWNSFQKYNIAYINGWSILEKNVGPSKSLVTVENQKDLFSLLWGGRVDLVIYEKWRGLDYLRKNNITGVHPAKIPLATKEMFLYMHKKHQNLIPKLEQALRRLKTSGHYDDIFSTTLGQK